MRKFDKGLSEIPFTVRRKFKFYIIQRILRMILVIDTGHSRCAAVFGRYGIETVSCGKIDFFAIIQMLRLACGQQPERICCIFRIKYPGVISYAANHVI